MRRHGNIAVGPAPGEGDVPKLLKYGKPVELFGLYVMPEDDHDGFNFLPVHFVIWETQLAIFVPKTAKGSGTAIYELQNGSQQSYFAVMGKAIDSRVPIASSKCTP